MNHFANHLIFILFFCFRITCTIKSCSVLGRVNWSVHFPQSTEWLLAVSLPADDLNSQYIPLSRPNICPSACFSYILVGYGAGYFQSAYHQPPSCAVQNCRWTTSTHWQRATRRYCWPIVIKIITSYVIWSGNLSRGLWNKVIGIFCMMLSTMYVIILFYLDFWPGLNASTVRKGSGWCRNEKYPSI